MGIQVLWDVNFNFSGTVQYQSFCDRPIEKFQKQFKDDRGSLDSHAKSIYYTR